MKAYLARIESLVETIEDWSVLHPEPLVSVWMITYNHEAYLQQALDGVLTQEVDFPIEIVIGDDCSTDGTQAILREYQQRHSDKIRLRLAKENLYSQNIRQSLGVYAACRGKYIALCEGDDYWTDPQKLQKQVAVLEAEPGISACFTNAAVLNEDGSKYPEVWLGHGPPEAFGSEPREPYLSQVSLIGHHPIPTCTLCCRMAWLNPLPDWVSRLPTGDWGVAMVLAEHGPIKYVNEITAVYRRHGGGVWSGKSSLQQVAAFIERIQVFWPHARPDLAPALRRSLEGFQGLMRRYAVTIACRKLEKGVCAGNEFPNGEIADYYGRVARWRIGLAAWERYFQQAYFNQDRLAARRRLLGLLIRHPEWLFRHGSLGQVVRTCCGQLE